MATIEEIQALEDKLLAAMRSSDVAVLDTLLADDLFFTDHRGQVLGKKDDLDAHRSGIITVTDMEVSEPIIRVLEDTAVVSVLLRLKGLYMNQPFDGANRYTRVWARQNGRWQIIAAHATQLAQDK